VSQIEEDGGMTLKVSPADPPVAIKLGNNDEEFLVDTGTTYSVPNTCKGNFSHETKCCWCYRETRKSSLFTALKI